MLFVVLGLLAQCLLINVAAENVSVKFFLHISEVMVDWPDPKVAGRPAHSCCSRQNEPE